MALGIGRGRLKIEDLLVAGTARLSALLMGKIKNFDMSALAAYEPKYLAGLQAQAYDIPLEKAWETGRQQMREKTRQDCVSQASTSQVRNFSMNLDFADESWRYILLPIYLNTYRYEDKTFQIMVNGQTGAIAGQRPVDWNKVWLAIAALLAPGICLGLVGLVTASDRRRAWHRSGGLHSAGDRLVIGVIIFHPGSGHWMTREAMDMDTDS